jgi:hypothetical protein
MFPQAPDWTIQLSEMRAKSDVIAIVDDDEPLRQALGSVLKAAGFWSDLVMKREPPVS